MSETKSGRLLGWLYGAARLTQQIVKIYPAEAVVFSSGAMLIEKQDRDDQLQRLTTRAKRGAVVITPERVVFGVSLLAPLNLMFFALAGGSLMLWVNGGGLPAAILSAFGVAWIFQRLPFRLDVPFQEMTQITTQTMDGATGGYHALIIQTEAQAYQIITTDTINEEIETMLTRLSTL